MHMTMHMSIRRPTSGEVAPGAGFRMHVYKLNCTHVYVEMYWPKAPHLALVRMLSSAGLVWHVDTHL